MQYKFETAEEASSYLQEALSNYSIVAGLDECGRGAMAGPVVAACAFLPKNHGIVGIKDSKKFSSIKRREEVSEELLKVATWGIGICEHDIVDEINIHKATHRAAKDAATACFNKINIDFLLCDGGLDLSEMVPFETAAVVKGDLWFECIGAASIIAKVFRDNQMAAYHDLWPEYGFDTNMGYGTTVHRKAIEKYGLSPIHRRTFGVCRDAKERTNGQQG